MHNINPNDKSILRSLAALEEAGEKGFSIFQSGDTKTGSREMKQSLRASVENSNAIQDPELKKQTKALLNTANEAIRAYMKNPNDENFDILKTDIITYKIFLNQHQEE